VLYYSLPSDVPANTTKRQLAIAKMRSTDKKGISGGYTHGGSQHVARQPLAQHATSAALPKTASLFPLLALLGLHSVFRGADHRSQLLWVGRLGRHCTVNLTGEIASSVGPTHYFAGIGARLLLRRAFANSHFVSTNRDRV